MPDATSVMLWRGTGRRTSPRRAPNAILMPISRVRRESNRAFVLMQYYGYLRRNPNDAPEAGLDNW